MLSAFRRLSAGAWGSERGGDCPLAGARACGPRGLFGPPGPQGGEGAGGRRSGRCLPLWPGKRLPDPGPVSRSGKRRFTETTRGRAQPGARAREGRGKGSCRGSCPSGLWRVGGRERGPEGPCGSSAAAPPQGTWAVRPWTLGRGRGAVWLLHQRREGSCLVPQQGRRCLRPQACCSCLAGPKVSRPQGEPAPGRPGPGRSALSPRGLLELASSGQEVASPVSSGLWKPGGPALAVGENLGRGTVSPASPRLYPLSRHTVCYGLNVCVTPNFICSILTPSVTVFGGGSSGSG